MKHVDNITPAAVVASEIGNWCISMPLVGKVIYYPLICCWCILSTCFIYVQKVPAAGLIVSF